LTNFHCILRLARLAPDEDRGSTIERDFAVDSPQTANGDSSIQLVIADRGDFTGQPRIAARFNEQSRPGAQEQRP
jgi:hypothetical protein